MSSSGFIVVIAALAAIGLASRSSSSGGSSSPPALPIPISNPGGPAIGVSSGIPKTSTAPTPQPLAPMPTVSPNPLPTRQYQSNPPAGTPLFAPGDITVYNLSGVPIGFQQPGSPTIFPFTGTVIY